MYSKYYDSNGDEINLFIFKKEQKLGVAVYKGKEFKEVVTLEKQFERLGL